MFFGSCEKEANFKLISICKASENGVKIDYMDSTHGISDIKKSVIGDTLELKVFIAYHKEQKSYDIMFEKNIKYIKIGERTYELAKLNKCQKVYSGKEAIDRLKNN